MATRLEISRPRIFALLGETAGTVLTPKSLEQIFRDHRDDWRLPRNLTAARFIEFLINEGELHRHRIELPYRPVTRFTWGTVSAFQLVQSISDVGYFSHYTAMSIHELTEQAPKTVYFNIEQKATGGGGRLSQAGIDQAFRRRCRVSSNRTVLYDSNLVVLNGQNTHQLGVETINALNGKALRVTNLERTLIDACVRPVYSGGIAEVAKAFDEARHLGLNTARIVSYLKQLRFTYPYHQAIGFYLQRAGFSADQFDQMREFPIDFDFYLTYEMKNPAYVPEWRLFVPQGMD